VAGIGKVVRVTVELDGIWELERTGGLLPPLQGVTKRIEAERGETRIGRLPGVPFHVDGLTLRYPGGIFVDVLSRRQDGGYDGAATFLGRRYATFRMRRLDRPGEEQLGGASSLRGA
jgi:hypothetical protein